MNGFENCIKNEITEIDKILFYFDMISNLRMIELKRFIEHSNTLNVKPININLDSEEAMMLKDIDFKLHHERLIGFPEFIGGPDLSEPATLTIKGKYLLEFIYSSN